MTIKSLPCDFGSAYRIDSEIGQGASGTVYRGTNKETGQAVAIKILHSQLQGDSEILHRFITERQTLTQLNNNFIIGVEDLVVDAGMLGIVMELAAGPTLGEILSTSGPLPPSYALAIVSQVAQGLAYAHSQHVVHRDIKPDNIIITQPNNIADPGVKIADFGIAKIIDASSTATQMVGTAHYMAPEFIQENIVNPSVDVYALGISLYQILSNRFPFGKPEDNPFAIAQHHLHSVPPILSGLEPRIWDIVARMLEKNAERRPSANDVVEIIKSIPNDIQTLSPLDTSDMELSPHPQTILRGSNSGEGDSGESLTPHIPNINSASLRMLDQPANATILKLTPQKSEKSSVAHQTKKLAKPAKTKDHIQKYLIITSVAIAVLVMFGVGIWYLTSGAKAKNSHQEANVQANIPSTTYPSGLVVGREAEIADNKITYTITYSSVKTPLSGKIYESVQNEKTCIEPVWSPNSNATPHSTSITSIESECGWTLALDRIQQNQPVTVKAEISLDDLDLSTSEDLQKWLTAQASQNQADLNDSSTTSTAYPLQRLIGMHIQAPSRINQGNVIPITIIGQWPGGENTLTPIYTTPSTPNPTSILHDITGGDLSGLRLTDRCSGAVSVTPDGHDMSALHPATCQIGATVGNYDVPEVPLTITSTGS
ncbi:serine/threonine protein kinase [Arcanobacterium phocae]|uniref:Serine/threonine protein kinase n=1 Tax=Arcanobacterium phocae TaxID=131112 RepID=A0A1H2LC28_9ACTO|nr:serine/threonine-protein kinase [Arcanobacterium phocae]SDU78577.1 serine/threonine protein kinase [Arcanobacterium phocae]